MYAPVVKASTPITVGNICKVAVPALIVALGIILIAGGITAFVFGGARSLFGPLGFIWSVKTGLLGMAGSFGLSIGFTLTAIPLIVVTVCRCFVSRTPANYPT